mgnify:CR=1 FL=1
MIRVVYHFSRQQWDRRRESAIRKRGSARLTMLRGVMLGPVSEMIRTAPRDTNRFANANVQAAQQAGIGPLPAPIMPLANSKYIAQMEDAADRQVARWEKAAAYEEKQIAILDNLKRLYGGDAVILKAQPFDPGTIDERLRRHEKAWVKATGYVQRANEEKAKLTPTSIAIGLYGRGRKGRAIGTQIVKTVYGGDGRVLSSADATVIELRNKEPHARILESRLGWAKKAKAGIRQAGGKIRSRKYAEALGLV